MNVSQAQALDFIAANHRAVMGTMRSDGSVHMAPVGQALIDGRIEVSTREPSVKVRNLRRDPRVTMLILSDKSWYENLLVYGHAELIGLPQAGPRLRTIYETIAGNPHPDWSEFDQAMLDEQRVVVRISIDRIAS